MTDRGTGPVTADGIVDAALAILANDGFDAITMRRVASDLGVSPIPVYSRIGNKDALLDAVAERLWDGLATPAIEGESWDEYAIRWCHGLHDRRQRFTDGRLFLRRRRARTWAAAEPLYRLMRAEGFDHEAAVRAIRLLVWMVIGHTAIELQRSRLSEANRPHDDLELLFGDHLRYVVEGLSNDRA